MAIVFDKRYSLAAKFFEYVFEPVLAPRSSLFYEINFHRFISTILYVHLIAKEEYSDRLLLDFQNALRRLDLSFLDELLGIAASSADMPEVLRLILAFVECHRRRIVREVESLRRSEEVGDWILELSLTAMHSLLTSWGERSGALDVFCDASKPMLSQGHVLDVMINRKDRAFIDIGSRRVPLSFNMVRPIQVVDSARCPGIQVADVFASAIAYSLKSKDSYSRQCLALCNHSFNANSLLPNLEYMDPSRRETFVNMMVLREVMERTLRGENLFDEMGQFIARAEDSYNEPMEDQGRTG
jgi:hypothetical protein